MSILQAQWGDYISHQVSKCHHEGKTIEISTGKKAISPTNREFVKDTNARCSETGEVTAEVTVLTQI